MAQPALYLVMASCLYGIAPCFIKGATQALNIPSYLFMSNAVGFLIANLTLKLRKTSRKVDRDTWKHILAFGCLPTLGTTAFLTVSYQYIAVGLSTMLHFAYPALVTVIMAAVFREKLSKAKIAAVTCALGGVVLIADLRGGVGGSNILLGMVCALASSVTYSTFVIANDKSRFSKTDPFVLFFYISGVNMTVFGGIALFTNSLQPTLQPWPYFMLLCHQISNLLAIVFFAMGVRRTGASTGAIINMLEPVVSMLSGMLIFHDTVTPVTLMGCGLILCSVVVVSAGRKTDGDTEP